MVGYKKLIPNMEQACVQGKRICLFDINEQFSYDLEMKTQEQKRNKKRTEIERFD